MLSRWFVSLLILCSAGTNGQIAMSCADGWELFQCSCYRLSSDHLSWLEAEGQCQKQGAHLVTVDSHQEQEYITDNDAPVFWIGLSDHVTEGQWMWMDGSDLNFISWLPNKPNGDLQMFGEEDCVEMSTLSGVRGWNDAPCEQQIRYMCEGPADINSLGNPITRPEETDVQLEWFTGMECLSHMEVWELSEDDSKRTRQWVFGNYETPQPGYAISLYDLKPSHVHRIHMKAFVGELSTPELVLDVATTPHEDDAKDMAAGDQGCPVECECEDGWINLLCSCYQIGSYITTWEEAEDECASRAAHLASVHSRSEQLFLTEMSTVLWIGLRTSTEDGTWVWSDGSTLDFFERLDYEELPEQGTESPEYSGEGPEGSGYIGEGCEGSGYSGEGPEGSGERTGVLTEYGNYYYYDDDDDFFIDEGYGAASVDEDEDANSRSKDCMKSIRRPLDGETRWKRAFCDAELPFMCKKPAKIVSCRTPQTYVQEGEHNTTDIQLHWRTENTCNVRFNVTHHNNGITLHSVNKDEGVVLHYQMNKSDTGVVHRLHVNAMLGYHPGESHSMALLVKPNHYDSE